jgi:O-antigen/teichoic acid export membrane protein
MLPGFYFEKKLFIQTGIEWTAAVISIALNLLLIPWIHKEGAAISVIVSYMSLVALAFLLGRPYLEVLYEWKKIFLYMLGYCVVVAVSFLSLFDDMHWNVVLRILFYSGFVVAVYYALLSAHEKKILSRLFQGLVHSRYRYSS